MGAVSAEDLDNSLSAGMDNALDEDSVLIESDEISTDTGLLAGDANDDSCDENGQGLDGGLENVEPPILEDEDDVITVNDWNELQHYCSLEDRNYTLKLKENTNFYPLDGENSSYQIVIKNNVTILGSEGAYIGDSSPDARFISYAPMLTEDDLGIGVHIENVTFKWIATRNGNEGVFLTMAGNTTNLIKNCYFYNITTTTGHSSIVYIRRGDAALENCTFINCSNSFGCVSIYDPRDDPSGVCNSARMTMDDCYFENNNGVVEPGCINNCGVLILNNTTFLNNSAGWWAGAIHTHGGANTTIYNSNFTDNLAGWNGGALYTYSWLQIYNTTFKGNKCITNNGGGAIGACWYQHSPFIHIEESYFEDNENTCWEIGGESTTGTGRGGAISIMDDGLLEVFNSTFVKNSAAHGTAICAVEIDYTGKQLPLDVKIIGNKFINHTRAGEVLDVNVNDTSICIIEDNYYLNNSIKFSNLNLNCSEIEGIFYFDIDINLTHPSYYDADILDKCLYDIYLDGNYYKTISDRNFTLDFLETIYVYVHPTIGNINSNGLYINKKNTTVSIDVSDIEYGESQTINFNLDYSDASGTLTVLVNNRTYEINLKNPSLDLGILPAGNYNVTANYSGDLKYYPSMNKTSFEVNRKILEEDVFDNSSNVSIKLPVDAKGTLTLFIQGGHLTKNIVNGSATIGIEGLDPGIYEATVSYSGDENYAPLSKNVTVSIKQAIFVNGSDVTLKLPVGAKGSFTLFIQGMSLTKNIENGSATIGIGRLGPGIYEATVSYSGDENYDPFDRNITISIKPITPSLVATKLTASQVTATYNVAKNLIVTLKDANGKVLANKKVSINIGSITKTLTTNNKGQVSLNVAILIPKTYVAAVKFAGGNSYNVSSVTAKVVVVKATPKLSVAKKTFKRTAKTKKVTAILKNNKDKVLKSTKLTMKVGKKTYTAKTNKKGVATFKVNLTKKGKYTGTVKFAGNKYFKSLSKKVKITIK